MTVKNHWSGVLLLDGKYLNKRLVLLLAIDYLTLDIVAHRVAPSETREGYEKLLDEVTSCGYKIKALVSDGHPGILSLTQAPTPKFKKGTKAYPRPGILPAIKAEVRLKGVPHQWCVVHAEREISRRLRGQPKAKEQQLRVLVHKALFAKSLTGAKSRLKELAEEIGDNPKLYAHTVLWIEARWQLLTLHHTLRVNSRKIPRSSNSAESTISYLNTRLKTLRKVRSISSARTITNLIVVNYRSKPLINTKNKLKRGKSPLALASGIKKQFNWMEFVQKSTR